MFGYVVVNKSELKFKEFAQYRRYYCGLCRRLKKRYGRKGQIALSYDMTFLVLLLSELCEPESVRGKKRCMVHPWKKQEFLYNSCTDYAADMTVLLTYYKCMDDFKDEKKWFRKLYAASFKKKIKQLMETYGNKIDKIETAMAEFSRIEEEYAEKLSVKLEKRKKFRTQENSSSSEEKEKSADTACLDALMGAFGQVLSQFFSFVPSQKDKLWLENLKKIGYDIGRFIYLVDAYDDLEKDRKKGCFNPLAFSQLTGEAFDDWIEDVLRSIIAQAAREFEKLPIIEDVEILRNILYSGIWTRFYQVQETRRNKQEKKTVSRR